MLHLAHLPCIVLELMHHALSHLYDKDPAVGDYVLVPSPLLCRARSCLKGCTCHATLTWPAMAHVRSASRAIVSCAQGMTSACCTGLQVLEAVQVEKSRPPDAHMHLLRARRLAAVGAHHLCGCLDAGWCCFLL